MASCLNQHVEDFSQLNISHLNNTSTLSSTSTHSTGISTENNSTPSSTSTHSSSISTPKSLDWDHTADFDAAKHFECDDQLQNIFEWIQCHEKSLAYYKGRNYKKHTSTVVKLKHLDIINLISKPCEKNLLVFILSPRIKKAVSHLNQKKLTKLKGAELLQELKKYLRPEASQAGAVDKFEPKEKDINTVECKILQGSDYISHRKKLLLQDSVQLGLWLELKFELRRFETMFQKNRN